MSCFDLLPLRMENCESPAIISATDFDGDGNNFSTTCMIPLRAKWSPDNTGIQLAVTI